MKLWSTLEFANSAISQQSTANLSPASDTVPGIVRLATQLETEARSISGAVVTPADLVNFVLKSESSLPNPVINTIPRANGTSFNSYKLLGPNNLKFVSSVSGDDVNGDGSLWNAYLTITNALNLANPGDTIVILPGLYSERIQLKNQVNLHFELGAILSYTAQNIGDILVFDSGISVNTKITGYGIFQSLDTNISNRSCFGIGQSSATASNVYIECLSVDVLGTQGNGDAFDIGGSSNVTLKINSVSALNYAIATDTLFSGKINAEINSISANTPLFIQNGDITVKGTLNSNSGIVLAASGSSTVLVLGQIHETSAGTEAINVSNSASVTIQGIINSSGPVAIIQAGKLFIKDSQITSIDYSSFTHSGGSLILRNVDVALSGSTDLPTIIESGSTSLYVSNSTLRSAGNPEAIIVSGDAAPHTVTVFQSAFNLALAGSNISNLIATPNNVVDTGV